MLTTKLSQIGGSRGFVISKILLKLLDLDQPQTLNLHIDRHSHTMMLTTLDHQCPMKHVDLTCAVKLIHIGKSFAIVIPAQVLYKLQLSGTGQIFQIEIDTHHQELMYRQWKTKS